ncbi:MAG: glycosyltransferase family 2 protein [Gammaproteobacteria bacterium]|nr:glycosyltransferase family 2 protein [Gammaproteobacteria bacterium]
MNLSVMVITLDEERNLARCLASLGDLADEIVVVDSGSRDATGDVARRFGARWLENPWPGNVAQNQFALDRCRCQWVLSIDADEALSPELKRAIAAALRAPPPALAGFQINRHTRYLGRWIDHVWYPEWRLRLVRRERARWVGPDPHGRLEVSGAIAKLDGDLLHYTYRDLDQQFHKLIGYARTSAAAGYAGGRRMQPLKLLLSPWFRFARDLLLKGAWRDGWRGVLIAYAGAFSAFMKQAYLYQQAQRERRGADSDQ